jgi:hypothetical protein
MCSGRPFGFQRPGPGEARLCGKDETFRVWVQRLSDQALADFRTVGVSGIYEGHAQLDGATQHGLAGGRISGLAPCTVPGQARPKANAMDYLMASQQEPVPDRLANGRRSPGHRFRLWRQGCVRFESTRWLALDQATFGSRECSRCRGMMVRSGDEADLLCDSFKVPGLAGEESSQKPGVVGRFLEEEFRQTQHHLARGGG